MTVNTNDPHNAGHTDNAGNSQPHSQSHSTSLIQELQLPAEELAERVRAEIARGDRTMLERMSAGELYHASDPEIRAASQRAMAAAQIFNQINATDETAQRKALAELLGTVDGSCTVRPDLKVDYGFNIHLGPRCFINFDSIFLDICPIILGEGCQIGPRAQFLTALHPMENHALRDAGWEFGAPITLGRNVWFGGGVTVLPGVTIGDDAVIGAGSTVTRDIPPRVFAAGSPARVIRTL